MLFLNRKYRTLSPSKVLFGGTQYTADEAVTAGLNQLYSNQTTDGGFAFYKGMKANTDLTIQVLSTLIDIQGAGYSVRQEVIDQAVRYLYANIAIVKNQPNSTDELVRLAYVLSRIDAGTPAFSALFADVSGRTTTQWMSDSASSDSLGYLALLATHAGSSQSLKDRAFAALINRVDIDSRGAYIKQNQQNIGWLYYETPEKDTALFLKALTADKRSYPETDNVIRWLVANRSSDGSWGSTNTSVAAIDALSSYQEWKHESESNFTLTTTLDTTELSSTVFNSQNIFSTIQTFLPIAKIETNKVHTIAFAKSAQSALPNNFYYDLSLKYYLPAAQIAPRDEGIAISRSYYNLTDKNNTTPLSSAKVGDVLKGVITIISPKERHFFAIEDYIPAGFELVNFDFATEDKSSATQDMGMSDSTDTNLAVSQKEYTLQGVLADGAHTLLASLGFFGFGSKAVDTSVSALSYPSLYPDFKELRDNELFLFSENVQPGMYSYAYYVRVTTPGVFNHLPAVASDLYFPENFGRTEGSVFTVEK